MDKKMYRHKRWDTVDKTISIFENVYFCTVITFLLFVSLLVIFVEFREFGGPVESLSFSWELVLLNLILAGFLFEITASRKLHSRSAVPLLTFLFFLAPILLIMSFGIFKIGTEAEALWLQWMGIGCIVVSLFCTSIGMATMLMEIGHIMRITYAKK